MQIGYALPVLTGSPLLGMFTHTSCEYFNRKVYNLLDIIRDTEHKHNLTKPTDINSDPDYKHLGLLGLVALLFQWHSNLSADRIQTALKAILTWLLLKVLLLLLVI